MAKIDIHLNGAPVQVPAGGTIADLVASRGLTPVQVAVEVNKVLVPRAQHGETVLGPGDRVEIVTLVGGG